MTNKKLRWTASSLALAGVLMLGACATDNDPNDGTTLPGTGTTQPGTGTTLPGTGTTLPGTSTSSTASG